MNESSQDETTELMDLPEPVVVKILSYLDLDCLRHSVAHVCQALRELAFTPSLWQNATIAFFSEECWEDADQETFARDYMATPFLRELRVSLGRNVLDVVRQALVASRCRLRSLVLEVVEYGPEAALLLQNHPELRELTLVDRGINKDVYEPCVAQAVRVLAPGLSRLELSDTRLLYVPAVGDLLSEAPRPAEVDAAWLPAQDSAVIPAGGEPEEQDQDGPGLQHLIFQPPWSADYWGSGRGDPVYFRDASASLARLIRRHHKNLRRVEVRANSQEVYSALAECGSLEAVSVMCDEGGQMVLALVRQLQRRPSLRRLRLLLACLAADDESPQESAARLAALLAQVAELPHLQVLELNGEEAPHARYWRFPFPGLQPLRKLLGRESPLRELHLQQVTPAGRSLLDELRRLAPPGLRLLTLIDCPCSDAGDYWGCRDRDHDLLRELPGLDVHVDSTVQPVFDDRYDIGFLPVYFCQCKRKKPRV